MDDLTQKFKLALEDDDINGIREALSLGADPNAAIDFRLKPSHRPDMRTPLLYVINKDRAPEVIEVLLRAGADPNLPDSKGRTLLMRVLPIENVKMLLKYGADPFATQRGKTVLDFNLEYPLDWNLEPIEKLLEIGVHSSKSKRNDLLLASIRGDIDYVKKILEDPTLTDEDVNEGLKVAGLARQWDVIEELFTSDHGIYFDDLVDYFYQGYFGAYKNVVALLLSLGDDWELNSENLKLTPLMRAAIVDDLDQIKKLIKGKTNIDELVGGSNALHMAVHFNSPNALKYLIKHGADVNLKIVDTPIIYAVNHVYPEIVRILIESGANPNAVDCDEGRPALMEIDTCSWDPSPEDLNDRYEIAHILLSAGADPNLPNKYGNIPLRRYLDDENMVRLLLYYGSDPHQQGYKGKSILDIAKEDHPEIIPLLLAYQDDPEQTDGNGITNLMRKVEEGSIMVIRYYLMKQPNLDFQDRHGNTALHHAVLNRRGDIVDLLLRSRANPLIKNKIGNLPIDYAHLFNDKEMIYLLQRAAATREIPERSSALIYQPGSRWAEPQTIGWKRDIKHQKIIPEYRSTIENDCRNPTKSWNEILSLALSLGLSEEQLNKLSKEQICAIMSKHLNIIGGDRFVVIPERNN